MKTYSTREVEDDINHVEWVPAEVAQRLYDAIAETLDCGCITDMGAKQSLMDALAAADGDH